MRFKINTKLDNPRIGAQEIQKAILQAAINNFKEQSPGKVVNQIADTISQLNELGKQMRGVFK